MTHYSCGLGGGVSGIICSGEADGMRCSSIIPMQFINFDGRACILHPQSAAYVVHTVIPGYGPVFIANASPTYP